MMCVISRDHERCPRLLWRLRGAGGLADGRGLASGKWKISQSNMGRDSQTQKNARPSMGKIGRCAKSIQMD
jgi:hypothetical protein